MIDPKELNSQEEDNLLPLNNLPGEVAEGDFEEVDEDMEDEKFWEGGEADDSYGSSGKKYGGYNGFSDDAIDDAFEGDPMNTWNVD
jgi:hypothetical protein